MELELPAVRIARALRDRTGNLHLRDAGSASKGGVKTGTVIVAVKYKDGVVIAADKQCSYGGKIFSMDFRKIHRIGKYAAIGYAGLVGLLQYIVDVYRQHISDWGLDIDELSLEGKLKLFKAVLQSFFFSASEGGIEGEFIMVGIDQTNQKPEIVEFDGASGHYVRERFAATGSGTWEATTRLKDLCHADPTDVSADQALEIAIRAIKSAGEGDAHVSNIELVVPMALAVSMKGSREIKEGVVRKVCARILKEERGAI